MSLRSRSTTNGFVFDRFPPSQQHRTNFAVLLEELDVRRTRASLVALLALAAICEGACAGTLAVTNTNDSGAGSLRGALAAAAPGDTIVFADSATGTIALASTLNITQEVTIEGPGAGNLQLDGQTSVQIMAISADGNLTLSGVAIERGKSDALGGGIQNAGTLTARNCVFTGNFAANGGAIATLAGARTSVDTTALKATLQPTSAAAAS